MTGEPGWNRQTRSIKRKKGKTPDADIWLAKVSCLTAAKGRSTLRDISRVYSARSGPGQSANWRQTVKLIHKRYRVSSDLATSTSVLPCDGAGDDIPSTLLIVLEKKTRIPLLTDMNRTGRVATRLL